jgi:hypothetical protein
MRKKMENLIVRHLQTPSEMEGLAIMLVGVVGPSDQLRAYFRPLIVTGIGRVIHLLYDQQDRKAVLDYVSNFPIYLDEKQQGYILDQVTNFIDQSYDFWLEHKEGLR